MLYSPAVDPYLENLMKNADRPVQTMEMGLELLPQGKIIVETERTKGTDEVKKIFAELEIG